MTAKRAPIPAPDLPAADHGAGAAACGGPFSPSHIRDLAEAGGMPPALQAGARPDAAPDAALNAAARGIAAPAIAPATAPLPPRPPALVALPDGVRALAGRRGGASAALAAAPPPQGLRLVPADGFIWGGRGARAPRTRGDHALIWLRAGAMRLEFPRRHRSLGGGMVQFIPAGTAFAALPGAGAAGTVVLITPDLVRDLAPALPVQPRVGRAGADAGGLAACLRGLAQDGAAPAALSLHLALLSLYLSRLAPLAGAARAGPAPGGDRDLVARFVALAGARLSSGETVADLAAALGTSSAALDAACRHARGRRAIEVIHDLRHDRAVAALRHSRRAVAAIAQDLGFASEAAFTRAFVARTGRLPATFRTG